VRQGGGAGPMSNAQFVIFAHSGGYDSLYQVATLAVSAAANGDDVRVILFFDALRRFAEDDLDDTRLPASYGEEGPKIEARMKKARAHSVSDLIDTARQTGRLKLYACAAQVKFLDISAEDLEGVVDEVISLPNFLKQTSGARTKLFI
jgi:peroxiredoxin family protein